MHGSAIEVNGGCVAFLGHSGVGKSTLVAAFRKLGYRVMADDICVVSVGCDCVPMIFPSYPQLKLCVDAAKKLSEKPKLLSIADPTLEKHSVPIQEEFCQIPLPLSRLYMLTTTHTQTFGLTPLKGVEKLRAIMNNTYRMCFLDGLDKKAFHFTQCTAVAECVMIHHVTRPCEPFRLDELVELLVGDFEQCL